MYTKEHIEKILKINGLTDKASEDDIRSVLLYAKCTNVDDAIKTLNGEEVVPRTGACGLQRSNSKCNILLADNRLRPEVIRELLGVDIEVTFDEIDAARRSRKHVSVTQMSIIFVWSLFFASICVFGVMWYYRLGLFHPGF